MNDSGYMTSKDDFDHAIGFLRICLGIDERKQKKTIVGISLVKVRDEPNGMAYYHWTAQFKPNKIKEEETNEQFSHCGIQRKTCANHSTTRGGL